MSCRVLVGPLVAAAKRLMPKMNQQELCNTAWALGVLGHLDKDTWQEFCSCIINTQGERRWLEVTGSFANARHIKFSCQHGVWCCTPCWIPPAV